MFGSVEKALVAYSAGSPMAFELCGVDRGSCRFVPSCADYTAEAIARYGLMRGSWLGARRLSRCQPFGGSGLDPVPREPLSARTIRTHSISPTR